MKNSTLNVTKSKVLPQVTFTHKQFLKQSFKKIDFHHVNIHKDVMEINGLKIKLLPLKEFPEYTNEQMDSMPIMQLWDLAKDFEFDSNRYGCKTFAGMLNKYGEQKMRARLKAYIYTHEDNHPVRCLALTHRTKQVIDLARELWTCNKLADISCARYNILQYTKPGIHLLKTLELL